MSFVPLGDTLHKDIKNRSQLKNQVEASQILEFASIALVDLLGKEQAYHARPLFLKNRTLTISCATTNVAQEIRNNQAEIVDKINIKLGKKEVDSIRYLA
ncbi:MAG: hypothetical protein A2725_00595 [Candidatus Magasanikbacteria bacterium RIFCSPHIGHO2_01_FULL_33_34]|uniref:DUF721 domain-containing protein n=1 Tax=Candidatus Magasanikbacteria bacterium RIFCSPHIGHO2_01_FULL_33_34 TaxID=1798671 RepID=A0A1F6LLG7_9BACT|nr:MAG: hypothetical protein A2725_00595 [Candidatus Magasanikbacteria bacterium RIFCSPHIGHO2_01_FULL_33_34]OGH65858.1 MAG: hypothetical protein A3B83_03265 [Candidatus Magasanikbacteria bacterium RIFCSPHIGHO2_02_FULL_33_17]OGH75223.1 MAG: hypothetical protein A3A89_03860 [Candidatus Magasanikbacteria bacterium RIFCSPLOWO2_01_FULL_33_34]OGH81859.1 MAG: hypothetical protein A3F93_01170 [Candidatus Magasanikbacteria bacterium RIFCSPLOWO2_12_FULL_34_7]